ncbi:Pescadillo N-terminus-domain-containing protein, partial [Hyaloraphidium curvatum]
QGERGAAVNYVTRNQALKKLQISLADFRRLCILKGVYPREPRNKKKANKGSTAPKTYYYAKDIQYLLHEPVLAKFREHKTFLKKLAKAMGKKEWGLVKNLEEKKPVYSLDHIVKERYPTFVDALRDLDDALSLITVFASLPSSERLPAETVERCRLLAAEFQHIVMHTGALKRTFLSIKGIYYSAEIRGQEILWVVPWRFATPVPADVDLRVLLTFLEFYMTLLQFVNFKLYSDANLVYPPKVDTDRDEGDWLELGKERRGEVVKEVEKRIGEQRERLRKGLKEVESGKADTAEARIDAEKAKERIKTLSTKLEALLAEDNEDGEAGVKKSMDRAAEQASSMSAARAATIPTLSFEDQPEDGSRGIFSDYVFYCNRETPIPSLLFVLRSFGAKLVGYPSPNSPITEKDSRITHQIVDRESIPDRVLSRAYVQPQWVYDCANRGELLDSTPYGVGKLLPPHLSPWVKADANGYDPTQRAEESDDEEDDEEGDEEEESESDEEGDDAGSDEDEEMAPGVDLSDAAVMNALEVEAESRGLSSAEFQGELERFRKLHPHKGGKRAGDHGSEGTRKKPRTDAEREAEERKELAKMMMTRKDRQLYEKMMFGKKKKQAEVDKLQARKQEIAKQEKKKAAKSGWKVKELD